MYIQITNRCNMSCAHCGMSCTEEGEDMSEEVFLKALDLAGEIVAIGGGEPTLHPDFWGFMCDALAHDEIDDLWLATNGSQTATAIKLAKLAQKGIIGCDLSQDEWHDAIDPSVWDAFNYNIGYNDNDCRGIRTITSISNAGRARENGLSDSDRCICDNLITRPNGDIYMCGCDDAPIVGTVWESDSIYDYSEYTCYQETL